MKVVINGKSVTLSNNNFLAQGGEGSVYVSGNTAFKIYNDPKGMIPIGKIQELSAITAKNVIKPQDIIFNEKNVPVGYTMPFIKNTNALCQVFTRAFKTRNGLKPKHGLNLIANMQETISHIHDKKILIVDLNEMNFLVDDKFSTVYFIDVDSYQTPSFHATALMESVRDRQAQKNVFNRGTDWFAFAVVSFQIMSGIHPYKGTHPTLKGFDQRMENQVSIFHPDVKVPKVVSEYKKVIPAGLLSWYEKVFQDGLRVPPPMDYKDAKITTTFVVQVISGSNNFIIDLYKEYDNPIVAYFHYMGSEATVTQLRSHFMSNEYQTDMSTEIIFHESAPVFVTLTDEKITLKKGYDAEHIFDAEQFTVYDNRIYFKYGDKLMEVSYLNGRPIPQLVGATMQSATKMFAGVSIQNMLGSFRASVFPESGVCYHVKLDMLTGYKVVDAKHDRNILVVVASKNGKYDRFVFGLKDGQIKSQRKVEDISFHGINFITLDKGVSVLINEEDKVEIFSHHDVNKIKLIEDTSINSNMKLFSKGSKVLFANNDKLYKLEMK